MPSNRGHRLPLPPRLFWGESILARGTIRPVGDRPLGVSALPVTGLSTCMRHGDDERFVCPHVVDNEERKSPYCSTSEAAWATLPLIDWVPQWILSNSRHRAGYPLVEVLPEPALTVFVIERGGEQFGLRFCEYAQSHEEVLCRRVLRRRAATSSQSQASVFPAS